MSITIESGVTINGGVVIGDYPLQSYRSPHTIITNGNAKVQTSFVKFGTGAYTPGTGGGFLSITPIKDFAFGLADFTIEFWFYQLNIADGSPFGTRPLGTTSGPYLTLMAYGTGALGLYANGAYRITSAPGSLIVNAWTAVSIVRYNGTTKMYLNGSAVDAGWVDATDYQSGSCIIGALDRLQNNSFYVRGYIDEFRVSNVARYVADYIPSTQPLVNDINTTLLLHCDGTNGSTTFIDYCNIL